MATSMVDFPLPAVPVTRILPDDRPTLRAGRQAERLRDPQRPHTRNMPSARKLTYTVVLEEDPPRHWHAYAPAVPGCFGGGRTRAEPLRRYRAALRLHLEELAARGGSLPVERRSPAVQIVVAA
jgi:predicted RNase H-like HicB family nuclease